MGANGYNNGVRIGPFVVYLFFGQSLYHQKRRCIHTVNREIVNIQFTRDHILRK